MLRLIFTNGNMRGVVQKDVSGLEDRVGKETEFKSIFVGSGFERRRIFW
jgi:hypothetical protein